MNPKKQYKKRYKQVAALGRALTKMAGKQEHVEPMMNHLLRSSTGRSIAPNISAIVRNKQHNDRTARTITSNTAMMFGAMGSHSHFRKPLVAHLARGLPGLVLPLP